MNSYPPSAFPTNSAEAMAALNGLNGFASSSANPDHFPPQHSAGFPGMRPPPPQPMHPLAQQNWMQQQQHYSHPAQVQQQYPPAWQNQMPPQGFHNGMAGLPHFIPQQVLHDAFALSHPVEPADEPVLLKALVDSRSRGETYKDALNRLHGMSGHSASLWKDYYLDNKDRLDSEVHAYVVPRKTVKKPSIGAFKAESSPRPSQQPAQSSQPGGSRRQTVNSMTAHVPVYNEHLPPPYTELKIPDPPSRSPESSDGRGNKFTPEDRAFFIKFVSWRLKEDPTLLRHELCELLAEKASKFGHALCNVALSFHCRHPTTNVQSWTSYWSSHHDLPDKILASTRANKSAATNESSGEEEEEEKPKPKKKKTGVQRKPKYRELSSESELTEDSEEDEPAGVAAREQDDAADDAIEIPPMDESTMGLKGGPFTKSDLGAVARHVASLHDWADLTMQDRWSEFSRRYTQRALKSWNEYYRRNQKTIDKLARKIRKLDAAEREAKQAVVVPPPPVAAPPLPKPIWTPETNGPPRTKRKFGVEEDLENDAKRLRPDGS
ncbi:hypothetical protein C8F04DRAFT_1075749 [Mycena alexandri]|uniref:Uncharacterized protein n=1 Tax=Mycena alexandri TaxID=1745969 RepID=A0AAD6T9R8_9AGAR|nr:hypothetical protein C8F04DRAFT_1075749 [Mycena alexandri]